MASQLEVPDDAELRLLSDELLQAQEDEAGMEALLDLDNDIYIPPLITESDEDGLEALRQVAMQDPLPPAIAQPVVPIVAAVLQPVLPIVSAVQAMLDDMGDEVPGKQQFVYLGTASRCLPETRDATDLVDISGFSRADIGEMVRDAFNNPVVIAGRAGRPRAADADGTYPEVVDILVVGQEFYEDGDIHFHWAVKLCTKKGFLSAKRTMRERYHIATHWSCSHAQFWSALRYITTPSEKKPVVDKAEDLHVWTHNGVEIDLFAMSQQPFMAQAWKRRREANDRAAGAGNKKSKGRFSKIDFTAIVLDQNLKTTDDVLEYFQDYGSASMQSFVSQHQRRLKEYLEDAAEWEAARAQANLNRETDWNLLCRHADMQCPCGRDCTYARAVQTIFDANSQSLSPTKLAADIRAIMLAGPSKTTPVPFIVGPTNSGKTTLVAPLNQLFGTKNVFHKPALNCKFALRNILKPNMRLIYWDDYRPVEYAEKTVEVSTVLSLFQGSAFEVQVSQSFNDGNVDFEWRRGVVWTGKEQGLWTPTRVVSQEDVRHMQSRVVQHSLCASIPTLTQTPECAICMARWIRDFAVQYDTNVALRPLPLAVQPVLPLANHVVQGLDVIFASAHLPDIMEKALQEQLVELGAVTVSEVLQSDLSSLPVWRQLKTLQQRRLFGLWPCRQ